MPKRVGVLLGRFQPRHSGHNAIIQQAASQCDHLLILIGSANRPRSTRNPWTYPERFVDMQDALPKLIPNKGFSIYPLNDYRYSDQQWTSDVEGAVKHLTGTNHFHFNGWNPQPILFGHRKPDTEYLSWFQWEHRSVESAFLDLDATSIRTELFNAYLEATKKIVDDDRVVIGDYYTAEQQQFLRDAAVNGVRCVTDVKHIADIDPHLIEDWGWLKHEKELFKNYPFPTTLQFVCSDAIVECAGHVLAIRRKNAPGKGVWAWPGGFKENDETFLDCAVRELKEEANIRVPEKALIAGLQTDPREKVLRGSIVSFKMFDNPHRGHGLVRSTMTFHFKVQPNRDGSLPEVNPRDDAWETKWFSFAEFLELCMHDDHQDMGYDLLNTLPTPAHLTSLPKFSRTL